MVKLEIKGMKCDGCVRAVTRSLESMDASQITVSITEGLATFDGKGSIESYIDALAEIGFDAAIAGS